MSDTNPVETELQDLDVTELEMQELEALEAPGWATSIGVSVGATLVSAGALLT
ncbi:hypothetical protein H9Y04_40765 [Streptomyces sp. TRM66268-LWL]|uniref:Bacteriocin n=1 Tax=Streptomyces polyasparticus TaxID=2767826 RepID=A0ABR7STR6_9ACTN|nr:daptide-type RiPP [Streptomyces polyasparticus]MBC9718878.1 hypothetical protein [Streptomyces polyasparticus]MBC9718880.1 hypothetical protein [Streptomyces polyasparticus]